MRRVRHSAQARDRSDEHEPPVLAREQILDRRLRAVERGGEIDGDDPVPALAAHLVEGGALGDPGIDHQHFDRAVQRSRFLERVADLLRIGDVAADRGSGDALRHLLQGLETAAEERDPGSGRMEMRRS